jgi:hypothetical protein
MFWLSLPTNCKAQNVLLPLQLYIHRLLSIITVIESILQVQRVQFQGTVVWLTDVQCKFW